MFVFGIPVDYWPVVGKFAETLESSYLDTQHRLREEAETLSAFAGLSVVSATSSTQIADFIQCVYLCIVKLYIQNIYEKLKVTYMSVLSVTC